MKKYPLFVSAQPDVPYFHWQIKIYIHNFIEKGIPPENIHIILGIVEGKSTPSDESINLKKYGVNIHHYFDNRDDKKYIPSIKPFLISKWLKEFPDNGKCFFLHDSDIVFRKLPDFETMSKDDILYLSDTIGYIGYDYIMDCCKRYEEKHSNLFEGQLLDEMTDIVNISIDCVKCNQDNSGGGQYLIKDTDYKLWEKIYEDCLPLYNQMLDFQKRYPIHPGEIQFWTAEMWSLLWNLWLDGKQTIVTSELDFSWATDPISVYERKPILHMAGVTDELKNRKFYKGKFINQDPLKRLKDNPKYFDYIEKTSSTIKYIEIMKSLLEKNKY
jgi:hypothetical protein